MAQEGGLRFGHDPRRWHVAVVLIAVVVVASLFGPAVAAGPAASGSTSLVRSAPSVMTGPEATALHALPPARVMDTRAGATTIDGLEAGEGALGPTVRSFAMRGRGGVPAAGVGAIALNVTLTGATVPTHVSFFPISGEQPLVSNLNVLPGQTVANAVVVRDGPAMNGGDNHMAVANHSGSVHVVIDVVGWFPDGGSYTSLQGARLADTRVDGSTVDGVAAGLGSVGPGSTLSFPVLGRGGVPAGGVGAVVLNVTVVGPSVPTHLTVHASGTVRPNASNLNVAAGETRAGLVVARVGADGKVSVFNNSGRTHVVVDVFGWFVEPGDLTSVGPARLLDTRPGYATVDGLHAGGGAVGPGGTRSLPVLGRAGIPSAGVGAVLVTVTAVAPSSATHLTVFPTGIPRPNASSVNLPAGATVANLLVARVGAGGTVSVFNNSGSTHVVVDVVGWLPPTELPPALAVSTVIGGLDHPWDIGFTDDGTMLFTERSGSINALVDDQVVRIERPYDVGDGGEGGMMGLAIDPAFAENRRIYTCYTTSVVGRDDVRVVRWRVSESFRFLSDRTDIVTGIPNGFGGHVGCRARFGPDGYLWITTGDTWTEFAPQDPQSLAGKVLRVDVDGNGAPGNAGGAFLPQVYTFGHRNPQGIAFRPSDGAPFSIEHGPGTDDEVNRLASGANFGWDAESGDMTDLARYPDAVEPIWASGRPTVAPSGGTFVSGPQWGVWDGALVFGCLRGEQLRVLRLDPLDDHVVRDEAAIRDQGRLRTAVQGPDGNLYVAVDADAGRILRVQPQPG